MPEFVSLKQGCNNSETTGPCYRLFRGSPYYVGGDHPATACSSVDLTLGVTTDEGFR